MIVYPVRFQSTSENASIKHVKVEPFTSLLDARKRVKELKEKPGVDVELLDQVEFTLNKAGVVSAFEESQRLLKASPFLVGK